jgi:hypothetical protein
VTVVTADGVRRVGDDELAATVERIVAERGAAHRAAHGDRPAGGGGRPGAHGGARA